MVARTDDDGIPPPWWRALAAQAALLATTLVLALFPFLGWMLQILATLTHEFGHALASWAFGRPAVPAFDFAHGGGITLVRERSTLLSLLVVAAWMWAGWQVRAHPRLRLAVGAGFAVWTLLLWSGGDKAVVAAMGHGGTLVFAAICLARSLTGAAVVHRIERPLYGLLGWALLLHEAAFALGLLTDAEARERYVDGKRGIDNDLVVLGDRWSWSLDAVAGWHLAATVLAAAVAFTWWWRWRRGLQAEADAAAVERWRAAR